MMLTVYEDDDHVFEALRSGATGYVLKTTPPDELLEAIRQLHAGGSPMSSGIARRVVETFHRPPLAPEDEAPLTPREEEVLALLVQGYRYREIAERLFVSIDTVRTHVRHVYEKMHVRSRAEATIKYLGRA
jgi:DNA-binding NarL/FixJ family response regulator